jgi:hypothetical protein
MKSRIIFCFLFLALFVSDLSADDRGPVAVSPGSDVGIAVVGENCPTFSWTAVDWATRYKVEVFEATEADTLSYMEMAARANPFLSQEIHGRALSWTPSSDERLINGGVFVWYVQATDAYGTAKWSAGKIFTIKVEDRLTGIVDKVTETLKANGVSDDVINDLINAIIFETKEGKTSTKDTQNRGYTTQDRIGIQGTEVGSNTLYGEYTGFSLDAGYYNTFIGQYAGYNTNSGEYNTFLGYSAGKTNTVGSQNIFVGGNAGYNASGDHNVLIGYCTGFSNTGNGNTFVGYWAGASTTSSYNTFVGSSSGRNNTSGIANTFIGHRAGNANSTGDNNTFMGYRAGYDTTGGSDNTFVGFYAGNTNDTGNFNTFIGRDAGSANTTGSSNIYMGYYAGSKNINGYANVFIGREAGRNNLYGHSNLFLGYQAGYNESGSDKLYIDNSDVSSPLIYGEFGNDIVAINGKLGVGTQAPSYDMEVETTGKNAIFGLDRTDGAKTVLASRSNMGALGTLTNHPLLLAVNSVWKLKLNADNSLSMSNGATCSAVGVWTDASSRAYKENIHALTIDEAKEALSDLNPVKYNYKKDKEEEYLGFIAEDVPDLVASKDRKGMSPMDVVAVLTKVVQEQQDTITKLQERIAKIESKSQ